MLVFPTPFAIPSPWPLVLSQAYGKVAAADDAGRFDLTGFLVWDLMHLNADGFTVQPNGGEINGCVDADSFYSPMWAMEAIDPDMELEQALERTVATQYLEVCGEDIIELFILLGGIWQG